MEKEEKNQNQNVCSKPPELMKWSELKRSRCPRSRRVGDHGNSYQSYLDRVRRKITTTPSSSDKEISLLQPTRLSRNSEGVALLQSENQKTGSGSPEKEERNYARRGSAVGLLDENSIDKAGGSTDGGGEIQRERGIEENRSRRRVVWPKLYITLSSKEKEEDFMAMKGCKPPHRPKKRAKIIQRTLLLVSPGAWLTDMCQERYEVREKKSSKKRPRGLKAMGSMESDSE
ncbi:hypothetical protein RHMOL_Rhmol03G0002100 [Rhododendron molle]|uniref:Uncharacterized protein n=1 Tax=Rhododendron molle TaxID=49168 RepID=A0ACC0PAE1_RHOML|nr:hypothetical protein RHMOL_Rhmol03G0002100 [Rhododendron molle]